MNKVLITTLLILSSNIFANSYNISESLKLKELYTVLYKSVFSSPTGNNDQSLKQKITQLKEDEKRNAHKIINELSEVIPADLLRYYITYKIISKDKSKLKDTLYLNMLYKSFILRDAMQSPLSSKELIKESYTLSKKIYHRTDLSEGDYFLKLNKNLSEKANLISKIDNINEFIIAVKETESLSFPLSKKYPPYSLSFTGFTPGNELHLINQTHTGSKKNKDLYFEKPIFKRYKELISKAKSSILISTPHLGGNLGDTFVDLLIKKAKEQKKINKNFKVVIFTPSTFKKSYYLEIEQTLNKLNNEINKQDLKSYITLLNSDIVASPISILKNNSRILVIDPNSDFPEAYIGSKNLTSSNGAYSFDNMLWIKGPAAALLNASIVNDIKNSNKTFDQKILSIISTTRREYPYAGIQKIRIVENDVTAFKNIKNFIIDMIINAKENIHMEQRYLFDPEVNDAIIKAKIKNPKLSIKILIDTNEDLGLNGLPNSIYIQELKVYGINIRARKAQSKQHINNRKIISVDRNVLLLSSSDINYQGLQGKQRDLGVQIFDKSEIARFDKSFKIDWSDKTKTVNLDIENFEAKIEGESLSKEFSSVINAISKAFIKFKSSFE